MDDIATQVRTEAQLPMWPIPEPDNTKLWLRFDCPFCNGNSGNSAAISYTRQRFECFRCDKTVGYSTASNAEDDLTVARLMERYREPISNVISFVLKKVGKWVTADGLHTEAQLLIWNYSCRAYGGPNDAGMWDEWEAITDGDFERMAQYVGKALKGDLLNHARDEVKWKRDAGFTNVRSKEFSVTSVGHMRSLGSSHSSLMGLAEDDRVSFTSWGNPGCTRLRNGLWPIRGHCQRCNMALRAGSKHD